ncbi:SIMPL domain-containing protein [Polaromonas aquatica]|uniref:SIMPL domain-containing protein n=1 Tax=Polaromonas aquatica TaxID=332657 RepID=UPI003D64B34F
MRISKSIAVCVLLGGAAMASAVMAQPMHHEPLQNVAQISTNGSVEVQQDLLSISLNTTRDGTDAGVVQAQLKQALDTALAQAKQAAVPGQMDVRTGNFSLYPRYNKDGKINGWQGSTELVLEGKDFPRITGTAGKIQTLTMGNVSFSLSREQRARVEGEAQAQAIERFKAKAGEVARSFGFSSYSLREVSINANDQNPPSRPRMMAMSAKAEMADASIPVEAGKSTVWVNVSGSVQMK